VLDCITTLSTQWDMTSTQGAGSTPINDGGPAFPVTPTDRSGQIADTFPGMTLRDYFAGQALAGIMASCCNQDNICSCESNARSAYASADAMLAYREKLT